MSKRVLCIWLPHWPIQRITAARPELSSARFSTATCGGGCRPPEHSEPFVDRTALEELAVWCGQFSPAVGVEDALTPESLFLEITGLEHLFGGEASLSAKILHALSERGLTARIGIADTLGAAWAAAHFIRADSKIAPNETLVALRPLPIEALRLPAETIDLLHSLGICRIGQLESLPRAELAARFGPRLAQRWDQAMGRLAEPVPSQPAPPDLEARLPLDYPTTCRETMEQILEQLVGRVAEKLVGCGLGTIRLECRLECSTPRPVEFSVGLFQPTCSAKHLFELLQMQLEQLSLPAPVQGISVAAVVTARLERRQEEFFSDGLVCHRVRLLATLVDRLSSRLGRHAILRPQRVADAQPEIAYRYHPLVDPEPQKRTAALFSPPQFCGERLLRPLRLFASPLPLMSMTALAQGPPLRFRLHGEEHCVGHVWGPERIETGWWRGPMIARDYYRIETTTGRRFWLFRELREGKWFVHGTFE